MLFFKRMAPFCVQILQKASLREEFSCFKNIVGIHLASAWLQANLGPFYLVFFWKWNEKQGFEHLTIDLISAKKKIELQAINCMYNSV